MIQAETGAGHFRECLHYQRHSKSYLWEANAPAAARKTSPSPSRVMQYQKRSFERREAEHLRHPGRPHQAFHMSQRSGNTTCAEAKTPAAAWETSPKAFVKAGPSRGWPCTIREIAKALWETCLQTTEKCLQPQVRRLIGKTKPKKEYVR